MKTGKIMIPAENSSSFGLYIQVGYHLVKVTGGLGPTDCNLFLQEIDKLEQQRPQHYIFDFGALDRAGVNWVQMMCQVQKMLTDKADGRMLRMINVSSELMTTLTAAGIGPEIEVCATLADACSDFGLVRKGALDTNIVVPFINSVADAVEKIIKVSTSRRPMILLDARVPLSGNISGLISVTSPTFSGTVIVSFPTKTILKMVSKLTGEKQEELNTLVQSAVGEFANIAVMSAKKKLNEIGYGLRVDIPSVTIESELPAERVRGCTRSVVVPLETELGRYFIDIRF